MHIAQEGEPVQILGAFLGNGINQVDVWSTVLTKIVAVKKPLTQVIERWNSGRTTVQGKKHVVQMIVGGMMQYLTNVQRMPEPILKRLMKIIREYLWDDRHNTPVGMSHVCLPVDMGGLGLLDLHARNEAIDVMWLKAYLDFSEDRPLWVFLADDLLVSHTPKGCRLKQQDLRINPFLQKWNPKIRGLPEVLKGMVNIANKYGLRLEGLAFSRDILHAMPMWDHEYAAKKELSHLTYPSRVVTCLRQNYGAMTVGEFEKLADVLCNPQHRRSAACWCVRCREIKTTTACGNPHLCCKKASDMISTLPSKWNPRLRQPEDYERESINTISQEMTDELLVPFD